MNFSLRAKILSAILLTSTLCTITAVFLSSRQLTNEGIRGLQEKSQAILSRLEVGAEYIAKMDSLNSVVKDTVEKYPDGIIPEAQKIKILKNVPIYAAFQLGSQEAEKEHYQFKVVSAAHTRNKDHEPTPEDSKRLEQFKKNQDLHEIIEESSDGKFLLVSRPVRIKQEHGCLTCHGNPANSPWHNGKDILGQKMENMKDGDLKGMFTIVSSLEPVKAAVKSSVFSITIFGIVILILALALGLLMMNKSILSLANISKSLFNTSQMVTSMSTEMASASSVLSSQATEQSSALEQTSATMEQLSAMVSRNSDNAIESNAASNESKKQADRGKQAIEKMIQAIHLIDKSNVDIQDQINESNNEISEIVKLISEIGEKTKVINDIVFQTKLLSFNASVEAARAGEHGKGFSVVAEEVGNLAQISGKAAVEINQMLSQSINKVEGIVTNTKDKVGSLMNTSKSRIHEGVVIAEECNNILTQVLDSNEKVNLLTSDIAEATKEQANGISEINKAVSQLNEVTHENSASAIQSSKSAEQLANQAMLLQKAVYELESNINGKKQSAEESHLKAS